MAYSLSTNVDPVSPRSARRFTLCIPFSVFAYGLPRSTAQTRRTLDAWRTDTGGQFRRERTDSCLVHTHDTYRSLTVTLQRHISCNMKAKPKRSGRVLSMCRVLTVRQPPRFTISIQPGIFACSLSSKGVDKRVHYEGVCSYRA